MAFSPAAGGRAGRSSPLGRRVCGTLAGGGFLMAFIPHTEADVAEMLAAIGVASIDQLFDEIPASLRVRSLAGIPAALNEMQIGKLMSARAQTDGRALC